MRSTRGDTVPCNECLLPRKTVAVSRKSRNTGFESNLVNDMIAARWRLNRALTIEKETLDLREARMHHSGELKKEFEVIPEPVHLAIAFAKECNESKTMGNLLRYEARYNR
jgi:hypothetical protein